jgi:aldehyde dehydrogenase (NAD+)
MPLDAFSVPAAHHLIGGAWVPAQATLALANPSTGEWLADIGRGDGTDIDAAVTAAHAARASDWGRMTALERGRILTRLGQLILTRVDDLAQLEANDVGKPLAQARGRGGTCPVYGVLRRRSG